LLRIDLVQIFVDEVELFQSILAKDKECFQEFILYHFFVLNDIVVIFDLVNIEVAIWIGYQVDSSLLDAIAQSKAFWTEYVF